MRIFWLLFGFLALGLGIIGIVLPVLPTTPFILLAAFCFAKSSERFHTMLVEHRIFGPLIKDWNKNGAIKPQAKMLAVCMMAVVFAASVLYGVPVYALTLQGLCLMGAAIFILSRPNGPPE